MYYGSPLYLCVCACVCAVCLCMCVHVFASPFQGPGSISDYSISFHYVSPEKMNALEYYTYHLTPFGIVKGRQNINRPHVTITPNFAENTTQNWLRLFAQKTDWSRANKNVIGCAAIIHSRLKYLKGNASILWWSFSYRCHIATVEIPDWNTGTICTLEGKK